MSGGSFNYLCWKDAEDFIGTGSDAKEQAERMVDELASLGYAPDAAQETAAVVAEARAAHARLAAKVERVKDVWQAVEWWRSGDGSEDDVRQALAAYRGEGTCL